MSKCILVVEDQEDLAFAAAAFTASMANPGSTLYVPGSAGNRPVIAPDCVGGDRAGIGVQQEFGDQPI
jgi:hypothetical protein